MTVELIVNCYENTWRQVLHEDFMATLSEQNQFRFGRRSVVINNVEDPELVARRAQALVDAGRLDAVHWVEECLPEALARARLSERSLGRIRYYSDYALVAIDKAQCPWLLLWDAEVRLTTPNDWITAAIQFMDTDPRILVANPAWEAAGLEREILEEHGPFALAFGFSDQVFLARTREFQGPIYDHDCLASWRYPTAHIAPTFEQRVDAYMRRNGRLRATYRGATYTHPYRGNDAYRPVGWIEHLRRARNRIVVKHLERCHSRDPEKRIYWRPR